MEDLFHNFLYQCVSTESDWGGQIIKKSGQTQSWDGRIIEKAGQTGSHQ